MKKFFIPILIGLLTLAPRLYHFDQFPKFIGDEGIYVSQAWWLVHEGQLGPYTYWYDHFPLGWLQIGLWQLATGGPFTFGLSVVSGRLLMILVATATNLILYYLLTTLTRSKSLAFLGSLIFALSPLAILFNRQVLLDNLAAFWLVASLALLFKNPHHGKHVFLSSLCVSLSILSKESVLFVLPAYLLTVIILNRSRPHRYHLLLLATLTPLFLLSFFPLLALLKGELLPQPSRVSFLGTLLFQAKRAGGFLPVWRTLTGFDSFLLPVGLGALLMNLIYARKDLVRLSLSLVTLSFLTFLMRGGLTLEFYVIPLLPLFVIHITLALDSLTRSRPAPLLMLGTIGLLVTTSIVQGHSLITVNATANQRQALADLRQLPDKDAVIVADNFAFLDLKVHDNFPNILWYSKADTDPEVRDNLLHGNPDTIDYILENSTMQQEVNAGSLPLLKAARNRLTPTHSYTLFQDSLTQNLAHSFPYTLESLTLYAKPASPPIATDSAILSGQSVVGTLQSTALSPQNMGSIQNGNYGALLITKTNILSTTQLQQLMQSIMAIPTPYPLLIIASQQGGADNSIPWINTTPATQAKSELEAFTIANTRGKELKNLGFNANLFTANESLPASYAKAMLDGYRQAGIIPVLLNPPNTSLVQELLNTSPLIIISEQPAVSANPDIITLTTNTKTTDHAVFTQIIHFKEKYLKR